MEKKYYITNKLKQKKGAFTKEELLGKITPTTLVWCEGMEDWKKANEVEDLSDVLKKTPPPVFSIKPHLQLIRELILSTWNLIKKKRKRIWMEVIKGTLLAGFFFLIFGGPWIYSLSYDCDNIISQFTYDKIEREEAQIKRLKQEQIDREENYRREQAEIKRLESQLYNIDTSQLTLAGKLDYLNDKYHLEIKKNISQYDPYRAAVQQGGINLNWFKESTETGDYNRKVRKYNNLNGTWFFSPDLPDVSNIAYYVNSDQLVKGGIELVSETKMVAIIRSFIVSLLSLIVIYFLKKVKNIKSLFFKVKNSYLKEILDLIPFMISAYLFLLILLAIR
jgi:uncharacterized protein DUF4339